MTTPNSRMIPITDSRGKCLLPEDDRFEPECGSIVLVKGLYGTAHQRFFDDGLWYAARNNRDGKTWEQMLTMPDLVLVYDAAERESQPRPGRGGREKTLPVTTFSPDGSRLVQHY